MAIAVETIAKTGPKSADAAQLAASIEAANAAIIEAAVNGVGRPGMGCTATAAYIEGTTLAIAHVGDSRAYLLHEGTLIRVTRDHSYVEELVDAGEVPPPTRLARTPTDPSSRQPGLRPGDVRRPFHPERRGGRPPHPCAPTACRAWSQTAK